MLDDLTRRRILALFGRVAIAPLLTSWAPPAMSFASQSDISKPKVSLGGVLPNSVEQKLEHVMRESLSRALSPGGGLAVISGGDVVYCKGFGLADESSGKKFDENSVTRLASITKIFTAIAILKLASEGKVNLDQPFVRYVYLKPIVTQPEFGLDERVQSITIRQLLQMCSGWDWGFSGVDRTTFNANLAKRWNLPVPYDSTVAARLILGSRLDFEPGSKQVYCNANYLLLGRVIEHVSGGSYLDYVRKEIASKMGVTTLNLASTDQRKRLANEVTYHDLADERIASSVFEPGGKPVTSSYGALKGNWAVTLESQDSAGGLACSVLDLARLAATINSGQLAGLISPRFAAEMTARPSCHPANDYFAMGVFVFEEGLHKNLIMGGESRGCSLLINTRPDGKAIAIAYNANDATYKLVDRFRNSVHEALNRL